MELKVEDSAGGHDKSTGDTPVITLPDELQDWATRNEPMISRLSAAIKLKPAPLPENHLWDMIASMYSTDWTNAKATVNAAERQLTHLNLPENRPLGLIGAAMHSDETVAAERQLRKAVLDFTIVNENLRTQVELNHLLMALLDHQATLHRSAQVSSEVSNVSAEFGAVAGLEGEEPADMGHDFGKASRKKPAKVEKPAAEGSLTSAFRALGRMIGIIPDAPKAKAKAPDQKL
ncbi:MAG: hypothetical protein ACAH80_17920 [Alphaproteobacteria bacterium]